MKSFYHRESWQITLLSLLPTWVVSLQYVRIGTDMNHLRVVWFPQDE